MRSLAARDQLPTTRRSFSCFVRGTPQPKGSMRGFVVRTKKTGALRAVVTADKPSDWQANVNRALQDRWAGPPMEGAVRVVLGFRLLRPASVPQRKRPRPTVKPDIDKLARGVLDAMKSICYLDDAQVVSLSAMKTYDTEAGVAVLVEECESGREG